MNQQIIICKVKKITREVFFLVIFNFEIARGTHHMFLVQYKTCQANPL